MVKIVHVSIPKIPKIAKNWDLGGNDQNGAWNKVHNYR